LFFRPFLTSVLSTPPNYNWLLTKLFPLRLSRYKFLFLSPNAKLIEDDRAKCSSYVVIDKLNFFFSWLLITVALVGGKQTTEPQPNTGKEKKRMLKGRETQREFLCCLCAFRWRIMYDRWMNQSLDSMETCFMLCTENVTADRR
jgi:hypothetical protein